MAKKIKSGNLCKGTPAIKLTDATKVLQILEVLLLFPIYATEIRENVIEAMQELTNSRNDAIVESVLQQNLLMTSLLDFLQTEHISLRYGCLIVIGKITSIFFFVIFLFGFQKH